MRSVFVFVCLLVAVAGCARSSGAPSAVHHELIALVKKMETAPPEGVEVERIDEAGGGAGGGRGAHYATRLEFVARGDDEALLRLVSRIQKEATAAFEAAGAEVHGRGATTGRLGLEGFNDRYTISGAAEGGVLVKSWRADDAFHVFVYCYEIGL